MKKPSIQSVNLHKHLESDVATVIVKRPDGSTFSVVISTDSDCVMINAEEYQPNNLKILSAMVKDYEPAKKDCVLNALVFFR